MTSSRLCFVGTVVTIPSYCRSRPESFGVDRSPCNKPINLTGGWRCSRPAGHRYQRRAWADDVIE